MKNKKLIAVLALVLILVAGFASAYMRKQTQTIENDFLPPNVSCRVSEDPFDGTTKTNIKITNTGNYKAYLRVRLVTYWVKEDGTVVFRESAAIPDFTYDTNKWVKDPNEDTYYYKSPVDPTYSTSDLLNGGSITLIEETVGDVTYRQVIDVFAEAILASLDIAPPAKTVVDAWGVTVSGNQITGIKS